MTKITYIPGEIANAAIDEHGNRKPVTRTQHIFDDAKGKSQADINEEFGNAIGGLNSQNYVTVDSFNALPATGEADTIYRVSNWDGTQVDDTVYSEYAWNGSAYVHLSTKTQIGEVFDISAYHATGGTLATYADLSAALDSNNGGGVPQSLQKGGMSVKFVQSSDNKYVQFRLMANEFTTDTTLWAIADEGVYAENPEFVYVKTDAESKILWAIKTDGSIYYGAGCPQQVKDYIEEKISSLSLDEYDDIVAFLSDYLGSDTTLKVMIDSINERIPEIIENTEFLEITTDSEDKILQGIKSDGTSYIAGDLHVEGDIINKGIQSQIDEAIEDMQEEVEEVLAPAEETLSYFEPTQNSEWLSVTTDKDRKILSFRDKDGALVENVSIKTPEISTNHVQLSSEGKRRLMEDLEGSLYASIKSNSSMDLSSIKSLAALRRETDSLTNEINSLKLVKNGNTQDRVTVNLRNSNKKKLILNLHKRVDTGTAQSNDVFLPNARNNFSDVRIFTNTGERLSYKVVNTGNYDIIPSSEFGLDARSKVWQNSRGDLLYNPSTQNYLPCISHDNGHTWEVLSGITEDLGTACYISFVNSDDVLFIGVHEKLYRSEYPYTSKQQVLDISENGTYNASGCHILSTDICEHPDGDLFLGAYQDEFAIRIFKSIDGGLTWTKVHHSTDYQHIHNIMCDTNQSPAVIYAGCDMFSGLYCSKDKGTTWTCLTEELPIPRTVDYGVVYSEPGFRILSGETSLAPNSHSLIKTTDDEIFTPILDCGQGIYMMEKLGNNIFASLISSQAYRNTSIIVSEDGGDTWKSAYNTMGVLGGSASDGFRLAQKLRDTQTNEYYLWFGCQVNNLLRQANVRIYSNENTYCAQLIVEVPENTSSIVVEDGYLISDNVEVYNDSVLDEGKIFELIPLNNGLIYESCSNLYFFGEYKLNNPLKHIGNYLNPVYTGNFSIDLFQLQSSPLLKDFSLDISNLNAITISFWIKTYSDSFDISIMNNLKFGNSRWLLYNTPMYSNERNALGVSKKIDAILDFANNRFTIYVNGSEPAVTENVDFRDFKNNPSWNIFEVVSINDSILVSEFTIREGVVNENTIISEYYSLLDDNVN